MANYFILKTVSPLSASLSFTSIGTNFIWHSSPITASPALAIGDSCLVLFESPIDEITCLLKVESISPSDIEFKKVFDVSIGYGYKYSDLPDTEQTLLLSGSCINITPRLFNAIVSKILSSEQASVSIPQIGNPIQTIYYGAPGTGKSHMIKNEIIPSGITPYRVTFYPDYYYSDFVGGLRPFNSTTGIGYKFEAGPFARALRDSFIQDGSVYIVIEEINRGNAAAIFGDLFQLLDRKGGKSEYAITNHDLYQYLTEEGVIGLPKDQVYIPSNLNIVCTMNTADQNVFVLDTAFKRRFRMEYVPINFNLYYKDNVVANGLKAACAGYLNNTSIFEDKSYSTDLKSIMGEDVYDIVSKTIATPSRNWPTFAAYVNAKIDVINSLEQKISEDKKLGPFFVEVDELTNKKAFADKVLYYLKQDVFKYEDNILNESYETIYNDFVNNGKDIFRLFEP